MTALNPTAVIGPVAAHGVAVARACLVRASWRVRVRVRVDGQ